MSQRNVQKLEKPAVKRTLRRFWEVTRMVPGAAFLAVFTSVAYVALLIFVNTWVMGLIVDRVLHLFFPVKTFYYKINRQKWLYQSHQLSNYKIYHIFQTPLFPFIRKNMPCIPAYFPKI